MGGKLGIVAALCSYCKEYLKLKVLWGTNDALGFKWIGVNSIISIMTMTYQPSSKLYALDSNDDECLS